MTCSSRISTTHWGNRFKFFYSLLRLGKRWTTSAAAGVRYQTREQIKTYSFTERRFSSAQIWNWAPKLGEHSWYWAILDRSRAAKRAIRPSLDIDLDRSKENSQARDQIVGASTSRAVDVAKKTVSKFVSFIPQCYNWDAFECKSMHQSNRSYLEKNTWVCIHVGPRVRQTVAKRPCITAKQFWTCYHLVNISVRNRVGMCDLDLSSVFRADTISCDDRSTICPSFPPVS